MLVYNLFISWSVHCNPIECGDFIFKHFYLLPALLILPFKTITKGFMARIYRVCQSACYCYQTSYTLAPPFIDNKVVLKGEKWNRECYFLESRATKAQKCLALLENAVLFALNSNAYPLLLLATQTLICKSINLLFNKKESASRMIGFRKETQCYQ